ncbi:hypothetical protein [Listeria costaricensis]|uniref:hypothetical protein n=1 Tax=Listeria costaricensis TaxID=2026604 RepID=UPI000C089A9A|nr:hypothetical protein [Listeria costaricensis]
MAQLSVYISNLTVGDDDGDTMFAWVDLPASDDVLAEAFGTTKKCTYEVWDYEAPFSLSGYSMEELNRIANLAIEKQAYASYFSCLDELIDRGFYEDLIQVLYEIDKIGLMQ